MPLYTPTFNVTPGNLVGSQALENEFAALATGFVAAEAAIAAATAGDVAPTVHAATSKATPVNADEFAATDSAAGFGLIRVTWANIKATLKTYFDTLYASSTVEAAIAPTLLNSWVNSGIAGAQNAGYWKDSLGMVHITGFVTTGTIGAAIFQLPAGYRPAFDLRLATNSNALYAQIRIEAGGNVVAVNGSNVSFSLDCSFRAV